MSVQRTNGSGPFQAGAWASQDYQITHGRRSGRRSHAEVQWDRRCRSGWEGHKLSIAWRTATPIEYGSEEVAARHHEPAATVLLAEMGVIKTVLEAGDVIENLEAQAAKREVHHSEMQFTEESE
mgnify:FL=1